MMLDEEERTMPPTVLGLEKARQRGQVARSGELTFAAVVLAATGFAAWSVPRLLDKSRAMLAELLGPANVGDAPGAGAWPSVAPVVMELAMLLAGVAVVAILVNLLQVGLLTASAPVAPDLARVSPAEGLRRIFSLRSLQRLVVTCVKLVVIGGICFWTIRGQWDVIVAAASGTVSELLSCLGGVLGGAMLRCGLALLAMAVLDYLYQRWQHLRDLRISPRQMRQEMRQLEGDPTVKHARRRRARRTLGQNIRAQVPLASVVIVDDRDLAVAVRMLPMWRVPVVTAKAAGTLGRRMILLAREHGRCVVEDSRLARMLFRQCAANTAVPWKQLDRVAEILAYALASREGCRGRGVCDHADPMDVAANAAAAAPFGNDTEL